MIRWLMAVLGIPLLWALGKSLLQGWIIVFGDQYGGWGSPLAFFLYGAGGMIVGYFFLHPLLSITYVFAHEMTHLLVGLLFFARPKRIVIHRYEGYVELSKVNCIIILAPYCIPFYLLLMVALHWTIQTFWPGLLTQTIWIVLYGICMGYHIIYTLVSIITVGQPDLRAYGRVFSYWLICVVNLLLVMLPLVFIATTGWTLREQLTLLSENTFETYQWVGQKLKMQYEHCFDAMRN